MYWFTLSGTSQVKSETGPLTWRTGGDGKKKADHSIGSGELINQGVYLWGLSWWPQIRSLCQLTKS